MTSGDGLPAQVIGDERGYSVVADGMTLSVTRGSRRPSSYARASVSATGDARVYILGVQFPDAPATQSFGPVADGVASTITAYLEGVSAGALTLEVTSLADSWFTASKPAAFYGADGAGVDDLNQPIYELAREVFVSADSSVDYRDLDLNANGTLEMGEAHVIVIQSGNDQAATGMGNDIWSHRWWVYGVAAGGVDTRLDGVLLSEPGGDGGEVSAGYVMVAASDPVGVVVHELLHSFGAPDLYDVSGSSAVPVGPWSVMDIGLWLGSPPGTRPCRPGGYLEWDIDADPGNGVSGWLTPSYPGDGEHTLAGLGSGGGIHLILTPVESEFFLLENRTRAGIDDQIPEDGLLIYHIDVSQPVNNVESSPPYRVWLEDPGSRPMKRGAAFSEDDGPDQASFTPATTPSSHTNRGDPTGIAITAVGAEGLTMPYRLSGAIPAVQSPHLATWPVPAHPGCTLSVLLPLGSPTTGTLDLVDISGRSLLSHRLSGGISQPLITLPARQQCGALMLVYRAGGARHTAPVIVIP
jgi:immune inhibitor A